MFSRTRYTWFMNPAIDVLPLLIWAIFAAACALSIFLGALLAYHWFRYAMNPAASMLATIVYAGTAFVLLSGLLASTIAIATL